MSVASQRVLDWLEGQPGIIFKRLYNQPSTALAIFRRMLPHLAKTLVMSMLFMPQPFPLTDFDAWIKADAESVKARDQSYSILTRLKVFEEARNEDNRPAYRLSNAFSRSLRNALTGGGDHRSFGIASIDPGNSEINIEYLDTYARSQWEAILYYVVGSVNSGLETSAEIGGSTKELLSLGGFVSTKGNRRAQITKKGFEFLLEEINAQIWTLLIEYLKVSETLQMDSVEAISFLFTLGSLELGTPYDTSNLTPTQRQMLDDLSDFGLVYLGEAGSDRYYPTRLATTLTSDSPALPNSSLTSTTVTPNTAGNAASLETEKGFIILETNYRLYAYTSSPLLIQIIALFASLKTRYPNMLTATLTKTSIQHAIAMGITADQIVTYLSTHAHPVLRKSNPILPPTVVDQIRLWQLEGERMKATNGFLIRDIGTPDEYERAARHAETLGVLVWRDDKKGWFFVTRFEQIQQFFKNENMRKKERLEGVKSERATPAR